MTGPDPSPSAIALKIDVPWDEANKRHKFQLVLLDADGQPVIVPAPAGERAFEITGEFETGRPAGLKAGTPLDGVLGINVGPLPLSPPYRKVPHRLRRKFNRSCFLPCPRALNRVITAFASDGGTW